MLPSGDPLLHEAFFDFIDKLDHWHGERKTQLAPQALNLVERDMSSLLGVQGAELTRLLETTRAVNVELRSIETQIRDHANSRARLELPPVHSTMQTLLARRKAAIQAGLSRVQGALSTASWNGVSVYINGRLRDSITTVRLSGN